jgi:hypothetical protein
VRKRKQREVDGVSDLRVIGVLFVLFAFVSSVFVLGTLALDVEEVALSTIEGAELAVDLAYEAVLEAEGAGANVSGLLVELNDCSEALSEAYMSNRIGNFDDAIYFADLCSDLVEGIEAEANELRDVAASERNQRLLLNTLGSVLAVGCILYGGFFGWRFFESLYHWWVLKLKPEVASNES